MDDSPGADEIRFVPLGGTNEVGMNAYLYGHDGQWLMTDLGIGFADERQPGVDILVPDVRFIAQQRDRLAGIVVTHAHEDHLGAIPYLWRELECPVYATPFACAVLKHKFGEFGLSDDVPLIEIPLGGQFSVGPFDLEFITITHSIPEPNVLRIATPAGTVLHTGDWKLDPDPLVGPDYDRQRLAHLAEEDILALVGDSTNALVPGHSGSEADVRGRLKDLVSNLKNRVAMTCFATNVARVETAARVAEANGRRLCVVGRAMKTMMSAAQACGYLRDMPPLLDERAIAELPRDEVMLLVTGSQGEARAALARIARDEHSEIDLTEGDAVIFSSRVIPGNEKAIHEVQNNLLHKGVEVLTEDDHFVHVSGHPCREELEQMYQWVTPRIAIPMHGEQRHLLAHAAIARRCQVPQVRVAEDGHCLRIHRHEGASLIGHVPIGKLAVDGGQLLPLDRGPVRERKKLSFEGAAVLTLVVDANGDMADEPQLTALGLLPPGEAGDELVDTVIDTVERAIQKIPRRDRHSDDAVAETARVAVRRTFQHNTGRRPMTTVHLVRVG
jgi:ribonuclease J